MFNIEDYFLERYSGYPTLALGYHGCALTTAKEVLHNGKDLKDSKNDYDWLGHGKYFWESNPERAMDWAASHCKRHGGTPAVIGALIDLSNCLNLVDSEGLRRLQSAYLVAKEMSELSRHKLPENKKDKNSTYIRNRPLDCYIVNTACILHSNDPSNTPYTTVRGVFWEGEELYPNAGFNEKNHIQICVRDTKAILAYFHPRCFAKK